MSDSTIVHLLRHGEVENPAGIVYGRLPGYHLSANGRAIAAAREAAAGQEAVCVSHQTPIWVTRRMVERRRLWHNPATRECALGSVTSFTYMGDQLTGIYYTVPARRQVTQGDAAQ